MKHVEGVGKDEDAPLRYMALDIETVSDDENKMPVAERDPIVMISLVFEPGFRGKKSIILSTRSGDGIEPCNDEKDMLKKLIETIMEYDPDVITGFNINNFDMPYIIDRMRKNNVKPVFGRCTTKYVRYDKFANRYKITDIIDHIPRWRPGPCRVVAQRRVMKEGATVTADSSSYWYDPRHRATRPGSVVILGDKRMNATTQSTKSHGGAGGNFCFTDAHVEWKRSPSGTAKLVLEKETDINGVWEPGTALYEHDTCLVN